MDHYRAEDPQMYAYEFKTENNSYCTIVLLLTQLEYEHGILYLTVSQHLDFTKTSSSSCEIAAGDFSFFASSCITHEKIIYEMIPERCHVKAGSWEGGSSLIPNESPSVLWQKGPVS